MEFVLGKKILVIGAHPDDEVLGCGGLIHRNSSENGKTDVLIVSEGTSAQLSKNKNLSIERHDQLLNAVDLLGGDNVIHWDYPDLMLDEVKHLELNKKISNLISEGGYDYVFTHHPYDVNLDHRIVFDSTLVATRPTPEQKLKGLFSYYVNSSTEWGVKSKSEIFTPNAYLNIENSLEKKIEAFLLYVDEIREFPHPRSKDAIKYKAYAYGSDIGFMAAEAFNTIYLR